MPKHVCPLMELYPEILEELRTYRQEIQKSKIMSEWNRQATELRKTVPDFDLVKTVKENLKFAGLLGRGKSVREAYEETKKTEV